MEFPIWIGLLLWLSCTAVGFGFWQEIDSTPGETQASTAVGRPRLAIYLHPRCPCSRAALEEFAAIVNELHREIEREVVFVQPSGAGSGWERGDLWNRAAGLPGVRVRVDTA